MGLLNPEYRFSRQLLVLPSMKVSRPNLPARGNVHYPLPMCSWPLWVQLLGKRRDRAPGLGTYTFVSCYNQFCICLMTEHELMSRTSRQEKLKYVDYMQFLSQNL